MKLRILSNFFFLPIALALCAPFSQAQSGNRTWVEQTDPSVTYAGSWYRNESTSNSGGSSALTNAAGARATINFTGTGIVCLGAGDPWSGVARVTVDGTMYAVDTYFSSTLYQRPFFAVRGLAAGPHTLTIEATHIRNINGSGSWVWIDAFMIENGSVATGGNVVGSGITEQSSPALIYSGTWYSSTSASHSGGSSALAMDANTSATISFNGTGISWTGYRDEWSGIAGIYVDGRLLQYIDAYKTPGASRQVVYQISGLIAGTHSLTIHVTGTKAPGSNGTWVWVDAFQVVP